MDISVVIPARNVAELIQRQLAALSEQGCRGAWEVIVADNGSTDETASVVTRAAKVFPVPLRLVDASRAPGINVARNDGIKAASGTKILLCDADDVVGDGWLSALSSGLDCNPLVGGTLEFAQLNQQAGPAWMLRPEPGLTTLRNVDLPTGANFAFRRDVFDLLSGFDEQFRLGYCEIDFACRAHQLGLSVGYVADAVVHYRLRESFYSLIRQRFTYGRGSTIFLEIHPNMVGAESNRRLWRARSAIRTAARIAKRVGRPSVDRQVLVANLAFEIGAATQVVVLRLRRPWCCK